MEDKNRLLLIGLDGATWDILNPLMQEGYLPHLKSLKDRGMSGVLESNFPPVTGSAWMSIATGKNPADTGIFDFLVLEDRSGWNTRPINSGDYKRNGAIWDLLSSRGKKVGVVNYPMLYPPYEINGVMVSGLGAPEQGDVFYPGGLKGSLRRALGTHKIYVPFRRLKYKNPKFFIRDLEDLIAYNYKLADALIDESFDFFIFVISASDFLSHYAWNWWQDKESKYHSTFKDIWKRIDELVGFILKKWGKGSVLVVSDHGMGELREIFLTNKWLGQQGYLNIKRQYGLDVYEKIKPLVKNIYEALSIILPGSLQNSLRVFFKKRAKRYSIVEKIDLNSSSAFALEHCGIGNVYINSNIENREEVRSSIINGLRALCSNSNRKLKIFTRENLYKTGGHLDSLPEILFMIDDNLTECFPFLSGGPLFREPLVKNKSGSHRMEGIFILDSLASQMAKDPLHITDIFNIALSILGEASLKDIEKMGIPEGRYNLRDEEETVRRLKDLGYL